MKKILFLDRSYLFKYVKSDKFESAYVSLTPKTKQELLKLGCNVIGCFEEEYYQIKCSEIPDDYLKYSFDIDRFLRRFSYEKRIEILGKEITFWSDMLDTYKPDCIVNEVCTIEWMEVLYIEAQKRSIPYHSMLYGFIPGKCYWLDSPFNSMLSELRWEGVKVTDDLLEKAEIFYSGIVEKHVKPYYVTSKKRSLFRDLISSVKGYLYQILKLAKSNKFIYELYIDKYKFWMERSISRIYRKYDKLVFERNREYVFYPLHFEPEATISYFAEFYSQQEYDISMIAHCLGQNQILIVKEHPQQSGTLLTNRFQQIKMKYKNVLFISSEISVYEIFKSIKLVITLTGTAGYEAMIMGIPTIVLGDVFYRACPCATYCSSFRELKEIIRKRNYRIPTKDVMLPFIAKFIGLQQDGYPVGNPGDKENLSNLTKTIESFISQ